ncbi:MAG: hypothetical protein E7271_02240 [Lachnospiraceae bacterium]|nr:hypothetical protein [Lachnospiraceae bacterium]MCR5701125.1 stage V sporulation protein AB [Lachnospiraceae bacterium]
MKYGFLTVFGLSAGLVTAGAFVAFIAMIGIFPKLAAKTKTGNECILYENCIMLGILVATLLQFFMTYESMGIDTPTIPPSSFGIAILIFIGTFGGIYIGFLIGGLSEVLNTFPIFARKTHIANKLPYVIYALALGKGTFNLFQTFILDKL